MTDRMTVFQGDITSLEVHAIVNAANKSLLGGGGVDGAIHRGAGPELLEECKTLGGCEPGQAKITKAYRLMAKHVIHTVGPIYRDGQQGEAGILASCYKASLDLAAQHACRTIAFPAISTGAYSYPLQEAIKIATESVKVFLSKCDQIGQVTFACFDVSTARQYKRALSRL